METTSTSKPSITDGTRPCSWCGASIAVARRPGRPRLYCGQSCRQRAYEHRHGLRHERTLLPLPGQGRGDRWEGSGYEVGSIGSLRGANHAMRPCVRPEGPRRETVCGVLARPVPGRYFSGLRHTDCATCRRIVARHPLTVGISPSNELSRLRSVIVEGLEQRLEPEGMLHWLASQVPDTAPY